MLHTNYGETLELSDLTGSIIVLRFFGSQISNAPQLLFLEHLYNKFKAYGIHLFFIRQFRKFGDPSVLETITVSTPFIEDNGNIAALFKAKNNDLVIIGRDFRIKFKYAQATNKIVYNQVLRYLFDSPLTPPQRSGVDIKSIIERLNYIDIETGKHETVHWEADNSFLLITSMVAPCATCQEQERISVLKEFAVKAKSKQAQILLLFGKGNSEETIRKLYDNNHIGNLFRVGIIQESENICDDEYYELFRLDVDPYTVIFNKKGELIFSEEPGDEKKMDAIFLDEKLS